MVSGVVSPLYKCMKYSEKYGVFACAQCNQTYRRTPVYEDHIASWKGERSMEDTFVRAMVISHNAVYNENMVKTYGRFYPNPKLANATFKPETDSRKVSLVCSKAPKWYEALGTNTVEDFRSQIMQCFDIGSHQPAKKLPARRMQRLL